MVQSLLAVLLVSVIPLNSAFIIEFNTADHCVGSTLGTFTGSVGSGCQTKINNATDSTELINVPGDSFNVIAHPVAGTDDNTAVAFYSNPDCSILIGFSNVPSCVGAGAYKSYEVIRLSDAWAGEYNLQPPQIISQKPKATVTRKPGETLTPLLTSSSSISKLSSTSTRVSSTSTTRPTTSPTARAAKRATNEDRRSFLRVPRSDGEVEHVASGKRMEHGVIRRTNQGVYKFHQIAKRAWQGVALEEWDDNIHKRNDAPLDIVSVFPRGSSLLIPRGIPPTSCNLVRSCMINSAEASKFGIGAVGQELLDTIKSLDPSGDYWTFLQRALVVEVLDPKKGSTAGFIYAQTELHNEVVQSCSDKGTQSDALISALTVGVDRQDLSDLRVDLKLLSGTAVTDSLFVSARGAALSDSRIFPICEAVEVNF